jgi:light-regulated signal transduction histidine kinase (bacteriophytochrome)
MTTTIDAAQLLAACARELLCIIDGDGQVVAAAGPWHDVVGIPAAEVTGAGLDAFVHDDDRPALRAYRAAVLDGEPHGLVDVRVAGTDRVFDVALRRAGAHVVASLRDVTAQRAADERLAQLNEQLQRANDELQRSNDELQRFAYVASHDLSEPLRMVTSYCGLLAEDSAGQLDETAREYLAFAVDGAVRMRTLIDDLLAYSRVSWVAEEPSLVSLDEVFDVALRDLGGAVEETGAEVVVAPLPVVLGDPGQLGQLAVNLLGNALKFRTPGTPPRVTVSADVRGNRVTLSVADNGIGIADKHRERVFVMFKRLHGRGAYDGNGIGLALCKRIAELHGGTVWVEEAPGGGSVFRVTLVAAEGAA